MQLHPDDLTQFIVSAIMWQLQQQLQLYLLPVQAKYEPRELLAHLELLIGQSNCDYV